jgi:hypothetical protein
MMINDLLQVFPTLTLAFYYFSIDTYITTTTPMIVERTNGDNDPAMML